jgi:hypothetical protein
MTASIRTALLGLFVALPLSSGCASRVAPFDKLDTAQVVVRKLQGPAAAQPQAAAPGAPGLIPGLPGIPGLALPPEMQQQFGTAAQQAGQALQSMGVPIPQLPGMGGAPAAPQQPVGPQPYLGYAVGAEQYAMDDVKTELLDVFGSASNFTTPRGPCQTTPGMAVTFTSMDGTPPVDVMISFTCGLAGSGNPQFIWPHTTNGLTPETQQKLSNIYTRLFGAPPVPGAS